MRTLLPDKMFRKYNSSLLIEHSKPITLCFTEFRTASYLVVQPYF